MKLTLLASSSSGNCALLECQDTRILVDAGLSKRQIVERLLAIGERPESLDAIVLTHAHQDHSAGAEGLGRGLGVPVYLTPGTAAEMKWKAAPELMRFDQNGAFEIGAIKIESFAVPHDAAMPVGFTFQSNGTRLGFVTDLGHIDERVALALQDCTALFMESNHDIPMLAQGPYPWSLRERIMGRLGHLSNQAVAQFIKEQMARPIETLILGHLSANTNHPQIVHLEASSAIGAMGRDLRLEVVDPTTNGVTLSL